MSTNTLLALLLSIAVVSSPCSAQEDDSVAVGWQRVVARLPSAASAAAQAINRVYAEGGVPLTYWVRDSLPQSALVGLVVHEHPCGVTALVKARRIPPQDHRLQAERVVELDSAGRELRSWPVPTDEWPLGIRGDELLVNIYAGDRRDLALAVRPIGVYRVVPFQQAQAPEVVECPPYKGFGESAYVRCSRFEGHLLAYEGPCT